MSRLFSLIGGLLLLAACAGRNPAPPAVQAQAAPPVAGAHVEHFRRTAAPFPPGEWTELARENVPLVPTNLGRAERRIFGRVEAGRLTALYEVFSVNSRGEGFPVSRGCSGGFRAVYAANLRGAQRDFDCAAAWPVTFDPAGAAGTDAMSRVRQLAGTMGGLPRQGVTVLVAAGWSRDIIEVTLTRFPERDGIAGTAWTVGATGPDEQAYIDGLLAWAEGFRPDVRRGVHNRL